MTIRYLARSNCANSAENHASAPGVVVSDKPALKSKGPAKPAASKVITKRPKIQYKSASTGPKRDFKSIQLNLKTAIYTSAATKNVKNKRNQSRQRMRRRTNSPEKSFLQKMEAPTQLSRVAALESPVMRLPQSKTMIPTVNIPGHGGKVAPSNLNSRSAVSNQKTQTVNT